jgi:hypothetical protein
MKVMKMPREQVQWFAEQMEKKLQENDRKGGWENCSPGYLMRRLREEYQELLGLMIPQDREKIIREAADIANFAMMIADIARKSEL